MALNNSGPISLGGSTLGQSVALELTLLENGEISLNSPLARELANILSGQISLSDFYGKSSGPGYYIGWLQFTSGQIGSISEIDGNLYVEATKTTAEAGLTAGTIILKIDKDFTITNLSSYYVSTSGDASNANFRRLGIGNFRMHGNELIGIGFIQGFSAGTSIDNFYGYIAKFNPDTLGLIADRAFGVEITSGTTSPHNVHLLTLSPDGQNFAIVVESNSTNTVIPMATGCYLLNKTNLSYVGPGYTKGKENDNVDVDFHPWQDSSGRIWEVRIADSSNASTTNRYCTRILNSNYTAGAYSSPPLFGYMDAAVGMDSSLYIASYQVGATRSNIQIQKINTTNSVVWTKQFATTGTSLVSDSCVVYVDDDDNIYLILKGSSAYIGTIQQPVIIKLNSSGTILWSKRLSVTGATAFSFNSKIYESYDPNTLQGEVVDALMFRCSVTRTISYTLVFRLPKTGIVAGTYLVGPNNDSLVVEDITVTLSDVTPSIGVALTIDDRFTFGERTVGKTTDAWTPSLTLAQTEL